MFGDKTAGNAPGASEHCAQCEAMLADALDGTLSAEEQAIFDLHARELRRLRADDCRCATRRGVAGDAAPSCAGTSGGSAGADSGADQRRRIPGYAASTAGLRHLDRTAARLRWRRATRRARLLARRRTTANVIPFPRRAVAALRRNGFGQIVLQPRLAMTAAMAFFSVALTMNITGFHPTSLRASDLTPSSLRRDVISANTHVVRYYESLRVVYELESRVHDLQSAQDTDAPQAARSAGDSRRGLKQPAAQARRRSRTNTRRSRSPQASGLRRTPAPAGGTI